MIDLRIHDKTAQNFAPRINEIFSSEQSLEQCFKKHFHALPFDRTDHWAGILLSELTEVWKQTIGVNASPTKHDLTAILHGLVQHLDFNLYTQVAMNLQSIGFGWFYRVNHAKQELDTLQKKWSSRTDAAGKAFSPFAEKARKIGEPRTDPEREYNSDLSAVRALRIISDFSPHVSFRVSPKGSTPAFADSRNISMIGQGGDRYLTLTEGLGVWYIVWGMPDLITQYDAGINGFSVSGIPYVFHSKSGGEVLNEVLFSRKIAYAVYGTFVNVFVPLFVLPRMNSVMVITEVGAGTSFLSSMFETLSRTHPTLELHKDARPMA